MSVTFKFILGFEFAALLSRINFGLLILAVTILVIMASTVTYYAIEEPAMKQVKRLTHYIKSTLQINLKETTV